MCWIKCITIRMMLYFSDSGSLYTFGETEGGKLGIGEDEDNSVPNKVDIPEKVVRVSCGGTHTVAVTGEFQMIITFVGFPFDLHEHIL